jgi:hypothetical protein
VSVLLNTASGGCGEDEPGFCGVSSWNPPVGDAEARGSEGVDPSELVISGPSGRFGCAVLYEHCAGKALLEKHWAD